MLKKRRLGAVIRQLLVYGYSWYRGQWFDATAPLLLCSFSVLHRQHVLLGTLSKGNVYAPSLLPHIDDNNEEILRHQYKYHRSEWQAVRGIKRSLMDGDMAASEISDVSVWSSVPSQPDDIQPDAAEIKNDIRRSPTYSKNPRAKSAPWTNAITYNCESLLAPGRLLELLLFAEIQGAGVLLLQGTRWDGLKEFVTHGWHIMSSGKSSPKAVDGVLIAVHMEVFFGQRAIFWKEIFPGRVIAARVKTEYPVSIDVHLVSAYAFIWFNEPSRDLETQENELNNIATFWKHMDTAIALRRRRSRLAVGIDLNGELQASHPHVGQKSIYSRITKVRARNNGHNCLDWLRTWQMYAANTIGKTTAQSWTWQSADNKVYRIDFLISTLKGQPLTKARTLFDAPVSFKGARDHRPVAACFTIGTNWRRHPPPRMLRWDKPYMARALEAFRKVEMYRQIDEVKMTSKVSEKTTCEERRLHTIVADYNMRINDYIQQGEVDVDDPIQVHHMIESSVVQSAIDAGFYRSATAGNHYDPSDTVFELIWQKRMTGSELTSYNVRWLNGEDVDQAAWWSSYNKFCQLEKLTKQTIRSEKKLFWLDLTREAYVASRSGSTRKTFAIVNRLAPKPSAPFQPLFHKGKWTLDESEELQARLDTVVDIWEGHEVPLYSQLTKEHPGWQCTFDEEYVYLNPEDVEKHLMKTKNHKSSPSVTGHVAEAANPLGAPAELWKMASIAIVQWVSFLFNIVLSGCRMAQTFCEGEVCWLRKPKGDGSDPNSHWRGIVLLHFLSKLFFSVLFKTQIPDLGEKLDQHQMGVFPGKSTIEPLMIQNEIALRFREACRKTPSNKGPFVLVNIFFDVLRAFDRVDKSVLLAELRKLAVARSIVLVIEETLDAMCFVLLRADTRRPVRKVFAKRGVFQGSSFGPILFAVVYNIVCAGLNPDVLEPVIVRLDITLHYLLDDTLNTDPGNLIEESTSHVVFVDDLLAVLLISGWSEVSTAIQLVGVLLARVGLELNVSKIEVTAAVFGRGSQKIKKEIAKGLITVGPPDTPIVVKTVAKYLGVQSQAYGRSHVEISKRISSARQVHNRLASVIWRSHFVPTVFKVYLWCSLVQSVLLYATFIWVLTNAQLRNLETFQLRCLRHLAKSPVHLTGESNRRLRERLRVFTVVSVLRYRRITWYQKVLRAKIIGDVKDVHHLVVTVLFGIFDFELGCSSKPNRPRWKQFCTDIIALHNAISDEYPGMKLQSLLAFALTEISTDKVPLSLDTLRWVVSLSQKSVRSVLSYHDEAWMGTNDFVPCPVCGLQFKGVGGMKGHLTKMHPNYHGHYEHWTGGTNFRCRHCNKPHKRFAHLMRHIDEKRCPVLYPKTPTQSQTSKVCLLCHNSPARKCAVCHYMYCNAHRNPCNHICRAGEGSHVGQVDTCLLCKSKKCSSCRICHYKYCALHRPTWNHICLGADTHRSTTTRRQPPNHSTSCSQPLGSSPPTPLGTPPRGSIEHKVNQYTLCDTPASPLSTTVTPPANAQIIDRSSGPSASGSTPSLSNFSSGLKQKTKSRQLVGQSPSTLTSRRSGSADVTVCKASIDGLVCNPSGVPGVVGSSGRISYKKSRDDAPAQENKPFTFGCSVSQQSFSGTIDDASPTLGQRLVGCGLVVDGEGDAGHIPLSSATHMAGLLSPIPETEHPTSHQVKKKQKKSEG